MEPKLQYELLVDKQDKRENIMIQLGKDIAVPDDHFSQLLIEVISVSDVKVSE